MCPLECRTRWVWWRTRPFGKVAVASVVLLVLAGGWDLIRAACDNKGASSSVGACHEPGPLQLTCDSITSQDLCRPSGVVFTIEINEDFPTGCIDMADHNCDEPLEVCYYHVECVWEGNKCQVKSGSQKNPVMMKKRTTVKCKEGSV
jgi:hypothetical protein